MNQLVVHGGLLIDGTGRPPIEKGVVHVEADRIVAVGTEENVKPASGAKVVDCGDQVLIPGLIDCHNHLALDPTLENWPARMNDSDAEQTLRAVKNLAVDPKSVIPAKAGIQIFQIAINSLDSGFHRSDDFLRDHQALNPNLLLL
jgi:cytosine/adenosine deaminase-related metal-dependent hydrolase